MTDPATLTDCEFCDGQLDPYEDTCSFCKKKQSRKVIDQCGVENCYSEALDSKRYCEKHSKENRKVYEFSEDKMLKYFRDWEGWECRVCGSMQGDYRDMFRHLASHSDKEMLEDYNGDPMFEVDEIA